MIRVLLAIQFGLTVAAVFAVLEALAPEPRRRRVVGPSRTFELAEMIVDLSHEIEGADTYISAKEIEEVEELLGFEPLEPITITGRFDDNFIGIAGEPDEDGLTMIELEGSWPFVTIGKDSAN